VLESKPSYQIQIDHRTTYEYEHPVQLKDHLIYLYPRAEYYFRILKDRLSVQPEGSIRWGRDPFENTFAVISFPEETSRLSIEVSYAISAMEQNPFNFLLAPEAAAYPFNYRSEDKGVLKAFQESRPREGADQVLPWLYSVFPRMPEQTMDILLGLNQAVEENFSYLLRYEEGIQAPNRTLERGTGSCRDFAWLFIQACRQMGFAARFVSGYLAVEGPSADPGEVTAGELHAWAEVYLPGAGWKGFDPTHGILTTHTFISTAVGPEPELVSPIQGAFAAKPGMRNEMRVQLNARYQPEPEKTPSL